MKRGMSPGFTLPTCRVTDLCTALSGMIVAGHALHWRMHHKTGKGVLMHLCSASYGKLILKLWQVWQG